MPEARYIPEHSVVRLSDGRPGYLCKNTGGKPFVVCKLNLGGHVELAAEIETTTKLTVIAYPVELASLYLMNHHKEEVSCNQNHSTQS